jgi:membrane protease YdiL (CAAX protease family)
MEPDDPAQGRASLQSELTVRSAKPLSRAERLQRTSRLLLFLIVALLVGPTVVVGIGSRLFEMQRGPFSPQFLLYLEIANFAVVLGLTTLLSLMEKRPLGQYGLPWNRAFKANFWIGFLFGLAEASVLIGLIQIFGGYSFGSRALEGIEVLRWGLLHFVLFLFVGLYEEFLFRGYPQFSLSKMIGFWPAAVTLSIGFGLIHLGNRGENWTGAASVVIVGLLFAFTLKRSGNLWYAVGLHAGFDWAQSYLYSVPDSGELLRGHLSNAVLQGPVWLTGGSVGPEASVFCFLTMGLQFLVVMWLFPAKKSENLEERVVLGS